MTRLDQESANACHPQRTRTMSVPGITSKSCQHLGVQVISRRSVWSASTCDDHSPPAVVLLVPGAVAAAAVRLAVAVFVVIPVSVRLVAAAVLAVALLLAVRLFHGAVALARVQLGVQQIVPVRGACQASVH